MKPKASAFYPKPWRLVVSVSQSGRCSGLLMTSSPLPVSIFWISLISGHFLLTTGSCSRGMTKSLVSDSGSYKLFIYELNVISRHIFVWFNGILKFLSITKISEDFMSNPDFQVLLKNREIWQPWAHVPSCQKLAGIAWWLLVLGLCSPSRPHHSLLSDRTHVDHYLSPFC